MYLMKRGSVYYLYIKDENGKLKCRSTKTSKKSEAKAFMTDYIKTYNADIKEVDEVTVIRMTYSQFRDFYTEYASKRFSVSYQKYLYYAFDQFGKTIDTDKTIDKITVADIHRFIDIKLSKSGERLVNGYLTSLQGAFQRAVEFGFIDSNVFTNIKKLKPKTNPPIFPTLEELLEVLKAETDEQLRVVYLFAFYTGMRMGEIRHTRWQSIDFEQNIISVKNDEIFTTKSKQARTIPLHPYLKTELLKFKNKQKVLTELVFNFRGDILKKNYVSGRFKLAVRTAKVNEKLHFHSLRHGHASMLVKNGVPLYYVKELLGHQSITTTEIYSHLQNKELANAVSLLPAMQ